MNVTLSGVTINGRTMISSDALVMQLREEDGMLTGRYSLQTLEW